MNRFEIESVSSIWSTGQLKRKAEQLIEKKVQNGYQLITVSFAFNVWLMPTAFMTFERNKRG